MDKQFLFEVAVLVAGINGQELEARAANGDKGNKMKHKEGDRVDIVYRPSKAKYVNILGDNHDIYISVALIACGLVMVILRLISK